MGDAHHHKPQLAGLGELAARLRNCARRVTEPRREILRALRDGAHPMSPKQVHQALHDTCDLATVYRSLHMLEAAGMVKRFDLGDGVRRFELLGEGDDGHHHHLVCKRCDTVVEIDDCFTPALEQRIASRSGFAGVTHRLEFFGTCPACQTA
ncbi:MAG: transcriptional repressor [Pedosphaera sp.]|nr:transcriptional repressor [Pedosphaera sp.]MSU43550.1 transcriptional repressor [Pedosphaera sp.]